MRARPDARPGETRGIYFIFQGFLPARFHLPGVSPRPEGCSQRNDNEIAVLPGFNQRLTLTPCPDETDGPIVSEAFCFPDDPVGKYVTEDQCRSKVRPSSAPLQVHAVFA